MPRRNGIMGLAVALAAAAGAGGCKQQDPRAVCAEVAHAYDRDRDEVGADGKLRPAPFVERCVREGWDRKRAECHARTGGMNEAFCDE